MPSGPRSSDASASPMPTSAGQKPINTNTALHFVPSASPKQTPATNPPRPYQEAAHGAEARGRSRTGEISRSRASLSRAQSRSATRQWTAHSNQNAKKMSSNANRDITKCSPSNARSSSRHAAEQRGPGQASDESAHDQHHQSAREGGRESPAEWRHPEQPLAAGDHPLADLWVDDFARARRRRCPWSSLS